MINELNHLTKGVDKMLKTGLISYDAFNYPKINNGCEIIP
jgi:hypothetical protein